VHPTGGSLRAFKQFAWLEAGSGKVALSRPTHQRVTHTVGLQQRSLCYDFGVNFLLEISSNYEEITYNTDEDLGRPDNCH
jgi:hypothetical protein